MASTLSEANFRYSSYGRRRVRHSILGYDSRVVQLENETGVHYRFIFLTHGIGNGEKIGFVGGVILVPPLELNCAGRHCGDERLRVIRSGQRRFEVLDVALNGRVALLSDGPRTYHRPPGGGLSRPVVFLVKISKYHPVPAPVEQYPLIWVLGARFKTGETLIDIGRKSRFPVFAVAGNIHAFRQLSLHYLRNRTRDPPSQFFPVVGLAILFGPHQISNFRWTNQAAHVGGQYS